MIPQEIDTETRKIIADERSAMQVLASIRDKKDYWIDNGSYILCEHAVQYEPVGTTHEVTTVSASEVRYEEREYLTLRSRGLGSRRKELSFMASLLYIEQGDLENLAFDVLILCHAPVAMPRTNRPEYSRNFCLKLYRGRRQMVLSLVRHQKYFLKPESRLAFGVR